MSKGGGGSPAPPKEKASPSNFVSGIQPYPTNGQFPIVAAQNFWDKGNFMMPGIQTPLMASTLLDRFPQLASLFGGQTPNVQTDSFAPQMAGLPPDFGTLKPNPVTGGGKAKEKHKKERHDALPGLTTIASV